MNRILADQLISVYSATKKYEKEGELLSILLVATPFEGISIRVSDIGITIDFSELEGVNFEYVKLYFFDRFNYDQIGLNDHIAKKHLILYFRKKFYTPMRVFDNAMWRYGILKNVIIELEKFAEISGLTK